MKRIQSPALERKTKPDSAITTTEDQQTMDLTEVEETTPQVKRLPDLDSENDIDRVNHPQPRFLNKRNLLLVAGAIAWEYELGNRPALEWILDQYKEKKPKDPTIAKLFNTYKFADYKT